MGVGRRSASCRRVLGGLVLAGCTSSAPQPAPVVEATPMTTPAADPPPLQPPPPVEPTPPPVQPLPPLPPATLTLHPVLLAAGARTTVDALPSGHVLLHDDYKFAVYPAKGDAATELRALPEETIEPRHLKYFEEGAESWSLVSLHGAWPDQLYAAVEYTAPRSSAHQSSQRWQGDGWVAVEEPPDDRSFKLAVTYGPFMPWVKGRWLAARTYHCVEGCPGDGVGDEGDEESRAAERKLEREIERRLARLRPLAVLGGKGTNLPELQANELKDGWLSLPSGDLYVNGPGALRRWDLTTRAWQSHTVPAGQLRSLAATSMGAVYHATCEPASLVRVVDATVTAVPLPEAGCVRRMQVDADDRLWSFMHDGPDTKEAPRIWRLEDAGWRRVELALSLPGAPKRWRFDGLAWTEATHMGGPVKLSGFELFVFASGAVWLFGQVEGEDLQVLAREQPNALPPFDLRTILPPFDRDACASKYVRLGTLPAGADPAKEWAATFHYLASLQREQPGGDDPLAPHVYEYEEDGEREFYAMLGETTEEHERAIVPRLEALLGDAVDFDCGTPPQPTREHPLPASEAPPPAPAPPPGEPG